MALADDVARVRLPAPSGCDLVLTGERGGDQGSLQLELFKGRLRSGETRRLHVDCARLPSFGVQVVGPSPALLQELAVGIEHRSPCRLDAEGRTTVTGVDPRGRNMWLACQGTPCSGLRELEPEVAGQALRVEPIERIVGLQVLGHDGRRLAFQPPGRREVTQLWAGRDEEVRGAGAFEIRVDDESLRLPASAIRWCGDLGTVYLADGMRRATLVVRCGDDSPPAQWLALQLQERDGRWRDGQVAGATFRFSGLDAGDYRLRWQVKRAPAAPLAAAVHVEPALVTTIDVQCPGVVAWHGAIEGWREIPPADRVPSVNIGPGGDWGVYSQTSTIDADGCFELLLVDGESPPLEVNLQQGPMLHRAQMVVVDPIAHRLKVPRPDLRWLDVQVTPRFGGTWHVIARRGDRTCGMLDSAHHRLLLPERGTVELHLTEVVGNDGYLTAVARVAAPCQIVRLAPTGGHWCEVRSSRPSVRVGCALVGLAEGEFAVLDEAGPGSWRVWVPDGATQIHCVATPGGEQLVGGDATTIVVP